MNPTNTKPDTPSMHEHVQAPVTPPSPVTPPDSPHRGPKSQRSLSQGSAGSTQSARSRQEYLDSLVPPTKEEFAHIAETQAKREAEQKRAQRHRQRQSINSILGPPSPSRPQPQPQTHHIPLASRLGFGFGRPRGNSDDGLRNRAATVIQRTYRGYRTRREIQGLGIDASTRWTYAVREAQWRDMTTPRARGASITNGVASPERPGTASGRPLSTARQNWKKVSAIARHAGNDLDADTSSSSCSDSDPDSGEQRKEERKRREEAKARRKQTAKMMGLQYFLEMIDLKHRYGSNLRVYHEEWKRAETNENFFYWLDYGEGKNLDIEACPRERLDREQVRYLSREERQYYLVNVDSEGRLCWAKNGARIDTTEKWKDSIHGIVPSDDPTPAYTPLGENQTTLLGDTTTDSSPSPTATTTTTTTFSSSFSSSSSITSANATRYASSLPPTAPTKQRISHHLSGATILNKLLRKTVRKNTWIFVTDTSFRLYVGIKNSGAFQHSSFLQGSRISAAGLVRVRDGRLTSLSPLSGHYRPPASNFRAFVRALREAGADMSRVSVSKSYAVLVGLEAYAKVRGKAGEVLGRVRGGRGKGKGLGKGGGGKAGAEEGLVVPEPEPETGPRVVDAEKRLERGGAASKGEGDDEAQQQEKQQEQQRQQQRQEDKLRSENKLAVDVLQKMNLGAKPIEPKGQKGGGDDQ